MEDIGIKQSWEIIEPFTDNSIPICARCNCRLTETNKSSWSDAVEGNKTQYICLDCRTIEEINIDKEEEK